MKSLGVFLAALVAMAAAQQEQEMTEDEYFEYVAMMRRLQGKPQGLVTVKLGLTITALTELNAEQGYMETSGWLSMQWNDSRFAITDPDVTLSPGSAFRLDTEWMWVPDIELFNAVSTGYKVLNHNKPKALATPSDGHLALFEMFTARSQCNVHSQMAAGDTVQCIMKFGSWTYSGYDVDLRQYSHEVDLSNFHPSGLWAVESASQERNVVIYPCCPEPYIDITFTLTFKKRVNSSSWW